MYDLYYTLKTKWNLYIFVKNRFWVQIVTTVVLLIEIIISVISSRPSWFFFGIVLFTISAILVIRDYCTNIKEQLNYHFEKRNCSVKNLNLSDEYVKSNYRKIKFLDNTAIYSPDINQSLYNSEYGCEFFDKKFETPKAARKVAFFILKDKINTGRYYFNDLKLRLKSDLLINSSEILELTPTDYYSGECTNEVGCSIVNNETNTVFNGIELWTNNNIIMNLNVSKCANYIGISTLAITSDNYLVMLWQSGRSAQSQWMLAPSGSGSAEYVDLKGRDNNFNKFIKTAMERELMEECGLLKNNAKKLKEPIANTTIIGYARILDRGGKPEFFGFSGIKKKLGDLRIPKNEKPFAYTFEKKLLNLDDSDVLINELNGIFLELKEKDMSFSLFLNFKFFIEYVKNNPKDYIKMINY